MADNASEGSPPEEAAFLHAVEAQRAASDFINNLVENCGDVLYEHYLRNREVPFLSRRSISDMLGIVNWLNLVRDNGEGDADDPEKGWVVEDEPSASPIDSWASGAVAVRMRSPGYKALHKAIIDDAPSEVGSVAGSARTRRSRIKSSQSQRSGRTTRTAKTSGTRQGSRESKMTPEERLAARIVVLTDLDTGPGAALKHNGAASSSKFKMTKEERARARALREMERAERATQRRIAEAKERERSEAEKHEKLMKELKGKDFTLDRNGNIIVVKPPATDKLPAYTYAMDVRVETRSAPLGSERNNVSRGGSGPGTSRSARKKSPKKRRSMDEEGGGMGGDDQFYQESDSQQPPLIQTMRLRQGVTLQEGEGKKSGPPRMEDPKHMSRHQFNMHQAVSEDEPVAGDASSSPKAVGAAAAASSTAGGMGMDTGSAVAPERTAEEIAEMEVKFAAAMASSIDPMADGRSLRSAGSAFGGGQSEIPEDDENLRLIRADDWGNNPPVKDVKPPTVHMKPSSRQRKETLGRSGPARDRPFITKKPLEHLPATFGSGSPVRTAGVGGESGMGSTFGSATEEGLNLNKDFGSSIGESSMAEGSRLSRRTWIDPESPGSIRVMDGAKKYISTLASM